MESPLDADNDPRGWSIDQVVYELCQTSNPRWSPPQQIPDRARLADALRQNHVDGDNLLALEMEILKDDLGITSFGQKRAIMRAVKFFRNNSRSYQQMAFQADSIARMQSTTMPSPQITQSRISVVPQSPAYYDGLGIHPSTETRPTRSPSLASGFSQHQFIPSDQPGSSAVDVKAPKLPDTSVPAAQQTYLRSTHPHQLHPNVTASTSTPDGAHLESGSKTHKDVLQPLPERTKQEYAMVKGKKKITPTFVRHLPESAPTEIVRDAYLSINALPIQDVFYYKVPTSLSDDNFYRVSLDESEQFETSGHFPPGQRRTIARLMNSFLRQGTTTLPRSGLQVKVPYSKSRVEKKLPFSKSRVEETASIQCFTLFTRGNGRPAVYKVDEFPELKALQGSKVKRLTAGSSDTTQDNNLTGSVPSRSQEGVDLTDLDYLLAKYPIESSDDGLPVYGDSGDEGDLDEDTWREIQEEKAEEEELRKKPVHLTPTQVETVMNEAIEEFKLEWRETKLAAVQMKAYRHWVKAAKNRSRQQQIQGFKHGKDHCLKRMSDLKREIAGNVWRNETEVKKQCQILEPTVHQHEEYDYYGQVMLRDTAPEKPSKEALAAPRVPKEHEVEDGEEVLESEPDAAAQAAKDDFIDDSSDAGSIHHDPDAEDWHPVLPRPETALVVNNSSQPREEEPADIRDTPIADAHADDADVESETDDDIVTPGRRKLKHVKREVLPPQTPTPKQPVLASSLNPTLAKDPSSSDNSDLDRTPRLPKSKFRNQGRSAAVPVDLTLDSSPPGPEKTAIESSTDFSVHTPTLNPVKLETSKKQNTKKRSQIDEDPESDPELISSQDDTSLPGVYDVPAMRDTDWSDIEAFDNRRALAKAVYGLDSKDVTKLASFLDSLSDDSREKHIVQGLMVFGEDDLSIEGIQRKHQLSAQLLVLLYLTYILGQNTLEDFELSEGDKILAFEEKATALIPFNFFLGSLIHAYFRSQTDSETKNKGKKRKRDQEPLSEPETLDDTDAEAINYISSDPLDDEVEPPSHKKRKRKVQQSQEAISQQYSDKMRIEEQERRRKNMAKKLASMQGDGSAHHIVNTEEPLIELHDHIASRVKPHQINGIQFMWREIIEDPKHQGCILAHTMGLGKTMQVISLLVTIAECFQSDDPKIRNLIPKHLRQSKTLILCPASLLNNWGR